MIWKEAFFIVANIMVLTSSVLFFYKKNIAREVKIIFAWTLASKIILTSVFALLFKYYFNYETDVDVYFKYALKVKQALITNHQGFYEIFILNAIPEIYYLNDRSYFFIKLLSLLHFITNDNFWLDCAWFSLFNFFCCWHMAIKVKKYYLKSFTPLLLILFFLPVPLFWSCGPIKDSIAFSMLLLIIGFILEIIETKKHAKYLIFCLIPLYIIFKLKFYVLGALFIICIPYISTRYLKEKWGFNKYYGIVIFCICTCLVWTLLEMFCSWFYTTNILALIYYNYEIFVNYEFSNYQFNGLTDNGLSFIPHAFKAFWEGLFMPLPWNAYSSLMLLESIFNLSFLLLTFLSVYIIIKEQIQPGIFGFLIMAYVSINSIAFGFSSPNWGTLSRYRIYYTPFYYYLVCYIFYNSKLGTLIMRRFFKIKLF